MAAPQRDGRPLLATLLGLTVISGLVDAVSYLGLGHVFTVNMTGDVVLLGFAAAGASGFSAAGCLTSLGAFVAGAAVAGRAARRLASRRRLLVLAMPDLTTTVLTMTLTGLAADSALAGGSSPQAARKVAAVLAMVAGGFAGASAFLRAGAGTTLLLGSVIVLAGGLLYWAAQESRQLDQPTA